ncbi:MAG: tetratricopeptide repeat protein [Spirochaetes bacterium]|nr:MAG: tetratricopeptide repeat protein [Spirochaetota bacterium]
MPALHKYSGVRFASRLCAVLILLPCLVFQGSAAFSRENSTGLYEQGANLALQGKIDDAIASFKRSLELNPYYSKAHYGLGKAYLTREGRLGDAVRHLRRSVELDARMASAHFYLGLAFMFQRNYEKSVHSFQRAYDYDPGMVEALYNIASIYDYLGLGYQVKIFYAKFLQESAE